ncbi:MAG: hypothetical protein JWQ49_4326, partial [Edaphobacter sp.]|nr:hypothetical protein [Edaphobacter sp.]
MPNSQKMCGATHLVIQHWLKPLKDDKREIFRAAADAQKIASLILSYHPDYAAKHPPDTQPDRPRLPPAGQTEAPRPAAYNGRQP